MAIKRVLHLYVHVLNQGAVAHGFVLGDAEHFLQVVEGLLGAASRQLSVELREQSEPLFIAILLLALNTSLIADVDIGVDHGEAGSSVVVLQRNGQLALELGPRKLVAVLQRLDCELVALLAPELEFLLRHYEFVER